MGRISIRKIVIILVVMAFFIIALYFGVIAINNTGKVPVSLSAFPNDTTIAIDGKKTKTGTLYLAPGTYKLEAKKEGYDSYTRTLVLKEKKQTIAVILTPNSEEAFAYGRNNESEYRKVQASGEVAAAETGKTFNEQNPIAKHLPYKTFFFSIGYRMDQTDPSGNSIIIEIDASEGYKTAALYHIRELGYDPTDFTINFRAYENPFSL